MNALLASLPAMQQPAGRSAAAVLPLAGASAVAVAPEASALPLFLDALRAVAAEGVEQFAQEEALPLAQEGEFANADMANGTTQPADAPMVAVAPALAGAMPAFAASASVSARSGDAPIAAAARIAPRAAPVAVAAAPQPVAPQALRAEPAPEAAPRGATTLAPAAARAESVAPSAGSERSGPAPSPTLAVQSGLSVGATALPAEAPVLKLPNGTADQWRQPLTQALGERLHVELGRAGERAVIRLDPPMMGSVEIVIRHEGGNLQVHLSATHAEVLRQLQSIGESLRQDLASRQYSDVSVHVSDASRDADGRQRQRPGAQSEDGPGQALAEAETGYDPLAFALATDRE